MLKKVGVLKQGLSGGTDRILDDFCNWLNENNYESEVLNDGQYHDYNDVKLIVLPSSELRWLWSNRQHIDKRCKVIVWCMGHDALQAFFFNESNKNRAYRVVFYFLYKTFTSRIINKNLLVYTDLIGENLDLSNLKKQLVIESFNIFPIPISIPSVQLPPTIDKNNMLDSFFWVGRVDRDFKVWSLLELLDDLNLWVIKNSVDMKFQIIGDGNGLDLIKIENYSFEIIKLGNLKYKDMENIIKKEASLVFAMGTSALEGAKLSVATIVVNPLREEEANVSYRWVHDSIGCSLGEFKASFTFPNQKKESLNLMLDDFMKKPMELCKSSYDYSKIFERGSVYKNMLSGYYNKATFESIRDLMFIPFFSYKFKKFLKVMVRK